MLSLRKGQPWKAMSCHCNGEKHFVCSQKCKRNSTDHVSSNDCNKLTLNSKNISSTVDVTQSISTPNVTHRPLITITQDDTTNLFQESLMVEDSPPFETVISPKSTNVNPNVSLITQKSTTQENYPQYYSVLTPSKSKATFDSFSGIKNIEDIQLEQMSLVHTRDWVETMSQNSCPFKVSKDKTCSGKLEFYKWSNEGNFEMIFFKCLSCCRAVIFYNTNPTKIGPKKSFRIINVSIMAAHLFSGGTFRSFLKKSNISDFQTPFAHGDFTRIEDYIWKRKTNGSNRQHNYRYFFFCFFFYYVLVSSSSTFYLCGSFKSPYFEAPTNDLGWCLQSKSTTP